MTFIKLDPNLMQGLIKNLESYADEAERARSNIHSSSVNNSHPVPEVDDATYLPAIYAVTSADAPTSRMMDTLNSMSINSNTGSSYNTTMGATINALGEVIDGLQERLQVIIDLNTDGISTTSSDGVPGYYLPDGTADTVENVKSYNTEAVATARADADALTQATASRNGTAEDGRTVDEILDSLTINQDNPVYGAAVVTEAGGAQAYLDLLYSVNDYYENDYKGECPEDHFQVASQVLGYVLAAASQWEGETLADDLYETIDSQNGAPGNMAAINMLLSAPAAHYGTDFLTNLADKLEDRDPDALVPAYQVFANNKTSTSDPMDGVLTAMGNNPEAALEYLTPEGDGSVDGNGVWVPGQTTVDRWTMLTSRDWDEDAPGLDALTAVTGAASSFRNRAPSETDPDVPATADARATYACGRAMSYFGGEGFTKKDFTDTMKRNLAVVVANSPEEVAAAAAGNAEVSTGGEGPSVARWGVTPTDMSTMIFRFGDSQDAMTVANTGVGDYHHRRIEKAMSTDDPGQSNLGNEYEQLATSSSYLTELSRMRYDEDMKADSRHAEDPSKASTRPVPNLLLAQAYGDAMNHGLLTDPSTLATAKGHDWAVSDPDHPDAAPTVDIAGLTRGQADDMTAWEENSVTNENDLGVLNEISHLINAGWGNGRGAASDARTN